MNQKLLSTILLGALLLCSTQLSVAQCEGRYSSEIFDDVLVTQNVQYGSSVPISGNTLTLKFDFYEPADDFMEARPLIILAHGGAFVGGNENSPDIVQLATDMAQRGYVCASINYRLIDTFVLPNYEIMIDAVAKAVADMKAAVRFFRKDADTDNVYGIDPDQIFVGGASAGGFMAVHTAYLDTYDGVPEDVIQLIEDNGGLEGNSGNPGYSSAVNGVINLCGAVGHTDWIQQGEEPIYSAHGTADGTVPYGQENVVLFGLSIGEVFGSEPLHQKADELGIYNQLFTIPGEDHMAHASSANYPTTLQNITDFLFPLVECESATGIESHTLAHAATIYPNPASESVTIDFQDTALETDAMVSLFDNMGRLVQHYTVGNQRQLTIQRNSLPTGLYVVRLQNGRKVMTQPFMFE